jgi:Aldehyde dehydrogenase family
VWVNTHMQLTHDAPFTGMKHSGLGSEMGLWSIYAYTDPQTVYRTRSQEIKKGTGEGALRKEIPGSPCGPRCQPRSRSCS